jgi:carboxyl-terminal processing protease
MGRRHPRLSRIVRWAGAPSLRALAGAIILFVAACAGGREEPVEQAHAIASGAARFFAVTYEYISDRFVDPIPPSTLAMSGLGNLAKIDPEFSVAQALDQIEVKERGEVIARFARPAREDASRWAAITVSVINSGREHSQSLRSASSDALYQTIADGAVKRLDPFSRYNSRDVARENRAAREGFGGIGVNLDSEGGVVRVVSVMADSPAARAGVKVDDRIIRIEGEPTAGLEIRDIIRRLRGPVGAAVSIDVKRADAASPVLLVIVRALVVPQTIAYRRDGEIAHIKVSGFNQRTAERLHEALAKARGEIGPAMRGVILDLRGNLGGLFEQAVAAADLFLAKGQIVSTHGRHRASNQVAEAASGDPGENVPVVVLVNGASASSAEIVAAALQDNGRAIVVGTTSYGKGTVQTVIPLPNEGELVLTWAYFHAPSGYSLNNLGINPSICTTGLEGAAGSVVGAVRSGTLPSVGASMAEWRVANHQDLPSLRALRGRCQPDIREREIDYEIAKRLLDEPGLYAAALRQAQLAAAR